MCIRDRLVGGLGYAVKNWWISLLLGLLYIAVALCLLFAPVSSYVALSVIFSISILVSGCLLYTSGKTGIGFY